MFFIYLFSKIKSWSRCPFGFVCAGHCHKVVSSCLWHCRAVNPDKQTALRCCLKSLRDKPLLPLIGFAYGQSRILIPLPCHCLNPTPLLLLRFKISNPPYALNSAVLLFSFHFFLVNLFSTARSARKGAGPQEGVLSTSRGQSNYLVFL